MLLHTITVLSEKEIIESGLPLTMAIVEFSDFMKTEIFPGGFLPTIQMVKEFSAKAGFKLKRRQSLQRHYAKTLDMWAAGLEAHKSEAIAIQSEEVYDCLLYTSWIARSQLLEYDSKTQVQKGSRQ